MKSRYVVPFREHDIKRRTTRETRSHIYAICREGGDADNLAFDDTKLILMYDRLHFFH